MNIVDVDWLENNLNNENIIILDCSWHLPNTQRSGKEEFKKKEYLGPSSLILMKYPNKKVLFLIHDANRRLFL